MSLTLGLGLISMLLSTHSRTFFFDSAAGIAIRLLGPAVFSRDKALLMKPSLDILFLAGCIYAVERSFITNLDARYDGFPVRIIFRAVLSVEFAINC